MYRSRRDVLRLLSGFGVVLALDPVYGQTPKIMTRKIPSTGEELPAIGLGTWQVFDAGNDAAARSPLREVIAGFAKAGGKLGAVLPEMDRRPPGNHLRDPRHRKA